MNNVVRQNAETLFADELERLKREDTHQRPANWKLSPRAVRTFILGGTLKDGSPISTKYFGDSRLIEIAIATLATDRGLLLIGPPGTAKSWLSENLAAAVSGDSSLMVQGTAGTAEETLRYSWNFALLIAKGPSRQSLLPSPLMRAMETGAVCRIEELTRIPSDVQDTLITLLSEKTLSIPELATEVQAQKGFCVIATANDRDKGVNDFSSALKRRFNTVVIGYPKDLDEEVKIVSSRVESTAKALDLPAEIPALEHIQRIVTIFRELRTGETEDRKTKLKQPTGSLSPGEAISVVNSGMALAGHFGDGEMSAEDLVSSLEGAVIKDSQQDTPVWREYLDTVVRNRSEWKDLYRACRARL